jgi:hypothetical protein
MQVEKLALSRLRCVGRVPATRSPPCGRLITGRRGLNVTVQTSPFCCETVKSRTRPANCESPYRDRYVWTGDSRQTAQP